MSEHDPKRGPSPWGTGGPTRGEKRGPKSERPRGSTGELRRVATGRGTRLGHRAGCPRGDAGPEPMALLLPYLIKYLAQVWW